MNFSLINKKKGSVLVLVLWIIAVLTVIAGFYSVDTRIRRITGHGELSDLQARLLMRSVLLYVSLNLKETLRYFNQNPSSNISIPDNLIIPDGTQRILNIADRQVVFRLEDERGKIDINNSSEEELKEVIRIFLLDNHGKDGEKLADTIVDSILDWRDVDNNPRKNGAENEYYQSLKLPYQVANRPFRTIDELLLVRGVTREIFWGNSHLTGEPNKGYGLKDILTVYNYHGKIIPQLSPQPLLGVINSLDKAKDSILVNEQARLGAFNFFDVLKLTVVLGNREYQMYFRYSDPISNIKILKWIENPIY